MQPVDADERPRWAGYAACVWALAFAALSFYWAAGGMWGTDALAKALRESADRRSAGFVAVLWVTALLKVGAAALALALVHPRAGPCPAGRCSWPVGRQVGC